MISDQAVQIAEFAAKALVAAEQLRIKTKPLDNFWLAPGQRDVLLLVPGLSKTIKNKLAKEKPLHRGGSRQHDDGLGRRLTGRRAAEAGGVVACCQASDGSPSRGNHGEGRTTGKEEAETQVDRSNPTFFTSSRSRCSNRILRSGGESRFRTARSTNCTNISRQRWAGPIPISTSSRSRASDTVIPNFWTTASRISSALIQRSRWSATFCPRPASDSLSSTSTTSVTAGNTKFCTRAARPGERQEVSALLGRRTSLPARRCRWSVGLCGVPGGPGRPEA